MGTAWSGSVAIKGLKFKYWVMPIYIVLDFETPNTRYTL